MSRYTLKTVILTGRASRLFPFSGNFPVKKARDCDCGTELSEGERERKREIERGGERDSKTEGGENSA